MGTPEEQRHVDWRRDYSQPETRMFSRYKLAISFMKEEMRIEIDRGRFFEEMDKLFREAKTCSISPFEEKMKSRGKKRKAAEVTTEHRTGRGGGRDDGGHGGGRGGSFIKGSCM